MAFGCGIVIAALVTLLFKSNPQQEVVLILNIILQAAGGIGIHLLSIQALASKTKSTYSFYLIEMVFTIINLLA
jgi:predicted permease